MGAGDAALDGRIGMKMYAGNAERIELSDHFFAVGNQFQQRSRQHIACSAHAAVQIKRFHALCSSLDRTWLIMLAR